MTNNFSRRGFTLIEMLVVIGVIGLLASVVLLGLGGARVGGRDAKRIADLRSIQTGLEAYYAACGFYPGTKNCETNAAQTDFSGMESALNNSDFGTSPVPHDPIDSGTYVYDYSSQNVDAPQTYVIAAPLENSNHRALDNDLDGNDILGVDCGSATDDTIYCVGEGVSSVVSPP